MEPNPLREIRDIRRQISKECDDEPENVFAYYLKQQKAMKASGRYKFVSKPRQADSIPILESSGVIDGHSSTR